MRLVFPEEVMKTFKILCAEIQSFWFICNWSRFVWKKNNNKLSIQAKLVEDGLDKKVERRPYLATECDDVKEADDFNH